MQAQAQPTRTGKKTKHRMDNIDTEIPDVPEEDPVLHHDSSKRTNAPTSEQRDFLCNDASITTPSISISKTLPFPCHAQARPKTPLHRTNAILGIPTSVMRRRGAAPTNIVENQSIYGAWTHRRLQDTYVPTDVLEKEIHNLFLQIKGISHTLHDLCGLSTQIQYSELRAAFSEICDAQRKTNGIMKMITPDKQGHAPRMSRGEGRREEY